MRIPEGFFKNANWYDLDWVKALAHKMGTGQSVIKHPDRDNYNITHTSSLGEEKYKIYTIIYQT